MDPNDIGTFQIAAGAFGTVTISTLGFLLMQVIKAFFPQLEGRAAEGMVLAVSALFAVVMLVVTDADWRDETTYVAWFVGTLALAVVMRGIYASLFKVSVPGVPPSPDAEAIVVAEPPRQEGIV